MNKRNAIMHSDKIKDLLFQYAHALDRVKMPLPQETAMSYVDDRHIDSITCVRAINSPEERRDFEYISKHDKISFGILVGVAIPVDDGWLLLVNVNTVLAVSYGDNVRYLKINDLNDEAVELVEIEEPAELTERTVVEYTSNMNEVYDDALFHGMSLSHMKEQFKPS